MLINQGDPGSGFGILGFGYHLGGFTGHRVNTVDHGLAFLDVHESDVPGYFRQDRNGKGIPFHEFRRTGYSQVEIVGQPILIEFTFHIVFGQVEVQLGQSGVSANPGLLEPFERFLNVRRKFGQRSFVKTAFRVIFSTVQF